MLDSKLPVRQWTKKYNAPLVPKLLFGNAVLEAPASCHAKLELGNEHKKSNFKLPVRQWMKKYNVINTFLSYLFGSVYKLTHLVLINPQNNKKVIKNNFIYTGCYFYFFTLHSTSPSI